MKTNPRQMRPQCPYCGALAPHGDSRIQWLNAHLDSRLHRMWWKIKKLFKKDNPEAQDRTLPLFRKD